MNTPRFLARLLLAAALLPLPLPLAALAADPADINGQPAPLYNQAAIVISTHTVFVPSGATPPAPQFYVKPQVCWQAEGAWSSEMHCGDANLAEVLAEFIKGNRYTQGRNARILAGDYHIDAASLPIYLKSGVALDISPGANIVVPKGYAGAVFALSDSTRAKTTRDDTSFIVRGAVIRGGRLLAAGGVRGEWTGVLFESVTGDANGGGIAGNTVQGMRMDNSKNAIVFHLQRPLAGSEAPAWIHNNVVRDITTQGVASLIHWQIDTPCTKATCRMRGNAFDHLVYDPPEGYPGRCFGLSNLYGSDNVFIGVNVWDIGLPGKCYAHTYVSRHADAENNTFVGGMLGDFKP